MSCTVFQINESPRAVRLLNNCTVLLRFIVHSKLCHTHKTAPDKKRNIAQVKIFAYTDVLSRRIKVDNFKTLIDRYKHVLYVYNSFYYYLQKVSNLTPVLMPRQNGIKSVRPSTANVRSTRLSEDYQNGRMLRTIP